MEFFLTDIEIADLIKEEKRIDQYISDFGKKLKEKKGHKEFDLVVDRFDYSAVLKIGVFLFSSPLIPLQKRGKG